MNSRNLFAFCYGFPVNKETDSGKAVSECLRGAPYELRSTGRPATPPPRRRLNNNVLTGTVPSELAALTALSSRYVREPCGGAPFRCVCAPAGGGVAASGRALL